MSSYQLTDPRFTVNDFLLENTRLTIYTSDANEESDYVPPQEIERSGSGDSVTWYELEPLTSATSKRIRKALANELVTKFLLIGIGGKLIIVL